MKFCICLILLLHEFVRRNSLMLKELSVLGSLFLGLVIAGIIAIALIPSSKADNCACVNTENGAFLYSGKCVSDNLPRGTIFLSLIHISEPTETPEHLVC